MADLSSLTDEQLNALAAQTSLAGMSDEQLASMQHAPTGRSQQGERDTGTFGEFLLPKNNRGGLVGGVQELGQGLAQLGAKGMQALGLTHGLDINKTAQEVESENRVNDEVTNRMSKWGRAGNAIGSALPSLVLTALTGGGSSAGGILAGLARAGAGGAAQGAALPTTSDAERNTNMLAGAGLGVGARGLSHALVPQVKIAPGNAENVAAAQNVMPSAITAASISQDPRLLALQSRNMAREVVPKQFQEGMDELATQMGYKLKPGQTLDSATMGEIRKANSDLYAQAFPKEIPAENAFVLLPQLKKALSPVGKDTVGGADAKTLAEFNETVLNKFSTSNGKIEGNTLQSLLKDDIPRYSRAMESPEGKRALDNAKEIIFQLGDADKAKIADTRYAVIRTAEDVLAKSKGQTIPDPRKVYQVLAAQDPRFITENKSVLSDLARAGQLVPKPASQFTAPQTVVPNILQRPADIAQNIRYNNPATVGAALNPEAAAVMRALIQSGASSAGAQGGYDPYNSAVYQALRAKMNGGQ